MLVADAEAALEAFGQFYAALLAQQRYGDHVCLAAQPADANGSPELLVERGVEETAAITARWAEAIADAVADRSSEGSILTALGGLELDLTPFAKIVEREILHGAMLGALDSEWERVNDEEIKPVRFAAELAEGSFSQLPYADAVRIFNDRKVLPKAAFDALEKGARRTAFTVAGMASQEMLTTTKAELARIVHVGRQRPVVGDDGVPRKPGPNLRDFRRFAKERLESAGWTPANKSHVETIYRTNVVSAYASGRYVEMRQPAVLAALPYWQIRGVNDDRARPTHKAAFGIVLPANHAFWAHAYPPFGYNCRCRVIARTLAWLKANSVAIGPVPKDLPDPGFDSGTSKLISVPAAALAPPPPPAPTQAPHLQPPLPPAIPAPARPPGPSIEDLRRQRREEIEAEERRRALHGAEEEAMLERVARNLAQGSSNPTVAKAKALRSAIVNTNTRARGMLRKQVETSLDVKLPAGVKDRKKRSKLTVMSEETMRRAAGAGTRGYHDLRTGEVVIKESVRNNAARALEYFEQGRFSDHRLETSLLQPGDAFFAKFEAEGRGSAPDPVGALNDLRTFFHEELHGYSRIGPRVYTGIGRVIEEVGTELNARHIVKNLTPEIAKNPTLAKRFGSSAAAGQASYQAEIDVVCDIVARHAQVSREAAGELVRQAHVRGLLSGGAPTTGPLDHLHSWVGGLDVSPERAQLIERDLQQAHAWFMSHER